MIFLWHYDAFVAHLQQIKFYSDLGKSGSLEVWAKGTTGSGRTVPAQVGYN